MISQWVRKTGGKLVKLFNAKQIFQEKFQDKLSQQEKRFLDRLATLGKRKGLHLSKDVQEVFKFVI